MKKKESSRNNIEERKKYYEKWLRNTGNQEKGEEGEEIEYPLRNITRTTK